MRLWRRGSGVDEWVDHSTMHFDIPIEAHRGTQSALQTVHAAMQPHGEKVIQSPVRAVFRLVPPIRRDPSDAGIRVVWRQGGREVGFLSQEASSQLLAVLLSLWDRRTGVSCLGQVRLKSEAELERFELLLGLDALALVPHFVLTQASGVTPTRRWSRSRSWMNPSCRGGLRLRPRRTGRS